LSSFCQGLIMADSAEDGAAKDFFVSYTGADTAWA
jgi:hypothetical protein